MKDACRGADANTCGGVGWLAGLLLAGWLVGWLVGGAYGNSIGTGM